VLKLIGCYLRAGVFAEGKIVPTSEGVPQGGPLSPLLANILLDDFDKELERRGHHFARYADDFVILVRSKRAAERVMVSVSKFLERELKLVINSEKSKVTSASDCEYLGFVFKGKRIVCSQASLEQFKYNIRRLTARSWGISMSERLQRLSEYIRGWMGYYRLSESYSPLPGLDEWIRRRVRMCYIKQWRKPRTRIRNLIKLGSPRYQAIGVGLSSKGPWRLAKTFGSQGGLSNAYLKKQGLVSLRELWIAFHYPK
jgi:RNA-directed DNA polymerase